MRDTTKNLIERPLTKEEKLFSEENYNLFLWYTKFRSLNQEEIDALIIPYLTIVKKYLSIPRLQQYKFSTILIRYLDGRKQCYYENMYAKKNMPENGILSLDYMISNDDGKERQDERLMMDTKVNLERNIIDQEVFKEFIDVINKFYYSEQMKAILYYLLEGYSEKETIQYMQEQYDDLKFDNKKFKFLLRQLRFAFKDAELESSFFKTSLCKVVYFDILEYAIKEKIITRRGAKLLYKDKVIGKGRDEGKKYLEEHQAEVNEIMDKLRTKYSCAG